MYNLKNKRFGHLTVLEDSGKRFYDSIVWHCRCDCGAEVDAPSTYLRSGQVDGCATCCSNCRPADITGQADRCTMDLNRRLVDITGKVYGELTAIRPTSYRNGSNVVWECICSCGKTVFVPAGHLRSGRVKSCGHLRRELFLNKMRNNHPKAIDLTGQRFGRLVAERLLAEKNKFGQRLWLCRCDCGNTRTCETGSLTSGATKSCGCAKKIRGSDAYNITCPECGKAYRVESLEDAPPLCPECTEKLDHE